MFAYRSVNGVGSAHAQGADVSPLIHKMAPVTMAEGQKKTQDTRMMIHSSINQNGQKVAVSMAIVLKAHRPACDINSVTAKFKING
ncbi:MAG: hypothetical protein ACYC3A_02450 [Halothiobacillus sp.]